MEQPAISTVQTSDTSGWNIVELVVVGAVWYTATVLLLVLSIFALYSIPSLGFDATTTGPSKPAQNSRSALPHGEVPSQ